MIVMMEKKLQAFLNSLQYFFVRYGGTNELDLLCVYVYASVSVW